MAHEALDPSFRDLVDEYAPVSQLGSGFVFTEGPIWHPHEHHLLFSDMPGDVRRKWDATGVVEIARPSNKGNGMTYDADLNLLICEHSTSSVVRLRSDGIRETLVTHYQGQELNSPNDLVVKSDGSIWFSDPTYGRMPGFGVERPVQLGFQGVYRIAPGQIGGDPQLMVDRSLFSQPNGLCFSPDESLLYINDTDQTNIRVFDVTAGGRLVNGRLFASGIADSNLEGVPDGMKCDLHGNVWLTAPGGLWVYSPQGNLIGKVSIPEKSANLHWGGPDWRTLFVCATHSVYSLPVKIGPRSEPFMRRQASDNRPIQSHPAAAPQAISTPPPATTTATTSGAASNMQYTSSLSLDPSRCAMIIMDMQNDVVMDGGAFASSGSPEHCKQQNAIANAASLASACRTKDVPVIHVWMIVDPGAPGLTQNCDLFVGLKDSNALVRGTWGVAPVPGLEPQSGDHIVAKMRMSAWEGTNFETVLKACGRDTVIETGAWTNMSIEHTARTGADKGYNMVIAEDSCSTMNADWHQASINFAMQHVAKVARTQDIIRALGG